MASHSITRRDFVAVAVAAAAALRCGRLGAEAADGPISVRVKQGGLRGVREHGSRIFRGVPFAEPPVGPLRFRAPVAKKAWVGERDATKFAAAAMQPGEASIAQSEDCLALNVWVPEGKGPFPVFVWIHGGGFTGGRSFDPVFDGTKFTRDGIVCVTVAYRLGIFGFLDVEPLLGVEYAGSGNNGLRDLMLALAWVRENIAAFGGDPERVTVGGESAGAKLTDLLMGVPSASGLFQQMISESGGAERVWSKDDAAVVSRGFAEHWSKAGGGDAGSLRTADAGALIEAQKTFTAAWPKHFPLRAEIDGTLIPRAPIETIARGSTRGKRLLIGTNRDESALFIGPHPAHDAAASDLGNLPLAKFREIYLRYGGVYPDLTEEQRRIRAVTSEEYLAPTVRVLDAHVRAGGKAWDYRLDFSESEGRLRGYAYHSLDIPLVWEAPHEQGGNAEAGLARQVHAAWVSFVRGETPRGEGLPAWPAYAGAGGATMVLDRESRVEMGQLKGELGLWDGVL